MIKGTVLRLYRKENFIFGNFVSVFNPVFYSSGKQKIEALNSSNINRGQCTYSFEGIEDEECPRFSLDEFKASVFDPVFHSSAKLFALERKTGQKIEALNLSNYNHGHCTYLFKGIEGEECPRFSLDEFKASIFDPVFHSSAKLFALERKTE